MRTTITDSHLSGEKKKQKHRLEEAVSKTWMFNASRNVVTPELRCTDIRTNMRWSKCESSTLMNIWMVLRAQARRICTLEDISTSVLRTMESLREKLRNREAIKGMEGRGHMPQQRERRQDGLSPLWIRPTECYPISSSVVSLFYNKTFNPASFGVLTSRIKVFFTGTLRRRAATMKDTIISSSSMFPNSQSFWKNSWVFLIDLVRKGFASRNKQG